MAFKFLKEKADQREAERLSHIRPDIQQAVQYLKTGVSLSESAYEHLHRDGLNSWEKEALVPFMDNQLLIREVEYCLKNCSAKYRNGPCSTYDEALTHLYVPLLLERLKG